MVEVFLLDGRSYRSPNARNRQRSPGPDTALLGAEQVSWLKGALARSAALWKFIACDMPLGIAGNKHKKRYDKWSNRDHGAPLGRELELAGILRFIKGEKIRNIVWLVADVHYAAAHHFHPDRAAFTDFNPFWQFIAGPFHTATRRPLKLDRTFGPEQLFAATPKSLRGNYAPSAGYLYFGMGHINGRTGTLTVSLRHLSGTTLYAVDLPAEG
jgi:alkaline phosphatase D